MKLIFISFILIFYLKSFAQLEPCEYNVRTLNSIPYSGKVIIYFPDSTKPISSTVFFISNVEYFKHCNLPSWFYSSNFESDSSKKRYEIKINNGFANYNTLKTWYLNQQLEYEIIFDSITKVSISKNYYPNGQLKEINAEYLGTDTLGYTDENKLVSSSFIQPLYKKKYYSSGVLSYEEYFDEKRVDFEFLSINSRCFYENGKLNSEIILNYRINDLTSELESYCEKTYNYFENGIKMSESNCCKVRENNGSWNIKDCIEQNWDKLGKPILKK